MNPISFDFLRNYLIKYLPIPIPCLLGSTATGPNVIVSNYFYLDFIFVLYAIICPTINPFISATKHSSGIKNFDYLINL